MTITAHLAIKQDGFPLVEEVIEFPEDDEFLWTSTMSWLVRQAGMARDVLAGPPPQAAPKLPREAWDPEYR